MKRFVMNDLATWKSRKERKPLLVLGARQVGKTWLLQEFGRTHYSSTAYVNLDNRDDIVRQQFESGINLERTLQAVHASTGVPVVPGKTLLILDEIQECPRAITALKYFAEQMPTIDIAAAGSLLGLTFHGGTGFPVGKVDIVHLYPLSFREYLLAEGNEVLNDILAGDDTNDLNAFSSMFVDRLRQYLYVGGMPEAVQSFLSEKDYVRVRCIQNQILDGYQLDISKHAAGETAHVLTVWNQIPRQLGNENGRFVFGQIRKGARARTYEAAITWLEQAGLAVRVPRIEKAAIPLKAYASNSYFKLFMHDVGLLAALAGLNMGSVLTGNTAFEEFKGSLTEQYVCQQLIADVGLSPACWRGINSTAEVDFVVQNGGEIHAIEVKAAENLSSKSLKAFHDKYPQTKAVRFSLSGYRLQDWMRNVPLYAIGNRKLWLCDS